MGRNVRAEETRAEMVLGRGVPEPLEPGLKIEFGKTHLQVFGLTAVFFQKNRVGRQGTLLCKEINIGYL